MVAQGYVDPDRIALLGQSAGAHRANVLLPDDDAGSAWRSPTRAGPTAWIADSTGDVHGHWEWPINVWFFKTTPRREPGAVVRRGPDPAAPRIETPTLLISGSHELGGIGGMTNEYIFSMLRRKGVDTKLIYFPRRGTWHDATAEPPLSSCGPPWTGSRSTST